MNDETNELPLLPKGLYYDKPSFYCEGQVFIPQVYELQGDHETIPVGFNSVALSLDGTLKAHIDWRQQQKAASDYISKGYKIFWKLNLGLFASLEWPLGSDTQFNAFVLALDHFRDSLWGEFKEHTIGISVYEGPLNFSKNFPWDEHQRSNYSQWLDQRKVADTPHHLSLYCRDSATDYLQLMTSKIPDALPIFLLMDVSNCDNGVEYMQLSAPDCFERFHIAFKKDTQTPSNFCWRQGVAEKGFIGRESISLVNLDYKVGVALPPKESIHPSYFHRFDEIFSFLHLHSIAYKIIPEDWLATEWDGLDYLIYSPKGVTPQGKRKLQGFCAAKGVAVSSGELLGFAHELDFKSFMRVMIAN